MNEFDKLKQAYAQLRGDYDELMRIHVMHLLVASQMAGLKVPKLKELH
jgi:hypothetical protein